MKCVTFETHFLDEMMRKRAVWVPKKKEPKSRKAKQPKLKKESRKGKGKQRAASLTDEDEGPGHASRRT